MVEPVEQMNPKNSKHEKPFVGPLARPSFGTEALSGAESSGVGITLGVAQDPER